MLADKDTFDKLQVYNKTAPKVKKFAATLDPILFLAVAFIVSVTLSNVFGFASLKEAAIVDVPISIVLISSFPQAYKYK